ncbi:hypothetical protein IGI37_000252 [Enterococcus sp. AZ194]|uniref:hypothetical protein n=1 Tax=Enterococcus sp. AZ194 TaxID=2774629 RepID=UPI003F297498
MIKITGVGNGKSLLLDLILDEGRGAELVQYDEQSINAVDNNMDTVFIVYDGFCISEFLEIAPSLEKIQYVPIFLMATNFYIFGINKIEDGQTKIGACPICVTKQTINKSFNLNLYDHLTTQRGFKSIEKSYGKELKHFLLLLLEMFDKNELYEYSFSYLIQGNTYSREKMNGLSNCSTCDTTNYENMELQKVLKEVL